MPDEDKNIDTEEYEDNPDDVFCHRIEIAIPYSPALISQAKAVLANYEINESMIERKARGENSYEMLVQEVTFEDYDAMVEFVEELRERAKIKNILFIFET